MTQVLREASWTQHAIMRCHAPAAGRPATASVRIPFLPASLCAQPLPLTLPRSLPLCNSPLTHCHASPAPLSVRRQHGKSRWRRRSGAAVAQERRGRSGSGAAEASGRVRVPQSPGDEQAGRAWAAQCVRSCWRSMTRRSWLRDVASPDRGRVTGCRQATGFAAAWDVTSAGARGRRLWCA